MTTFFSAVVISGDLNISKPDPAIFQECLGQLRTRPERAIYVGDHPQKDVGGAVKSGMYGVFIDRHHRHHEKPYSNMEIVRSLQELPELIQKL